MLTIVKGIGLLLLTLACFSVFSLKFPKGSEAMSGMANAAVASFLVEAVHHYITGDLLGIAFFSELGTVSGSFGGIAAATLVPISMGCNPVLAVVAGVAVGGYGTLSWFCSRLYCRLCDLVPGKETSRGSESDRWCSLQSHRLQELLPSQLIRSLIQHCSTSDV